MILFRVLTEAVKAVKLTQRTTITAIKSLACENYPEIESLRENLGGALGIYGLIIQGH